MSRRFRSILPRKCDPIRSILFAIRLRRWTVSVALSIFAVVFQLCARARGFSRVRVTALLACRRGIDWLKLTPTLPPVNANWRRPNWIIGGNATIAPTMWTYRPHLYPHVIAIFVLVSFTLNFSIVYLLSDLSTYTSRYHCDELFISSTIPGTNVFSSKCIFPMEKFLFH